MPFIATTPALAYYLWPPRWVGAVPAHPPNVVPFAGGKTEGSLADVIHEASFPGFESRAYRDGMLAYNFSDEGELPKGKALFSAYTRRVRIINAHLACLKASMALYTHLAPATWETVVGIDWEMGGAARHVTGGVVAAPGEVGTMIMSLASARSEPIAANTDWRFIRMAPLIGRGEIERSCALLDQLLTLDPSRREDALLYAELLLRAQAALSAGDNAGALVYAWTVAEALLRAIFLRWVDDLASRQDVGKDRVFLDADRKRQLESSKMTAWHVAELGSLAGWLPLDLYRTVRMCAKARNRWLHDQDLLALEKAPDSIRAAQELFKLAEGIDLLPPGLESQE